jgi:hypothetical protein
MALELRQKHLDAKLQIKDRPLQTFMGMQGMVPGPGSCRHKGYDGPQFRRVQKMLGRICEAITPKNRKTCLWSCCIARHLEPS